MYPLPLVQILVLCAIILALTCIVVFLLLRTFFRTYDVRKHGTPVQATVTEIHAEFLPFSRIGPTTLFFVHADWQDAKTGKVYHFVGEAGGVHIPLKHPPGSTIEVLIDPRNPRHYEVQLPSEERNYL